MKSIGLSSCIIISMFLLTGRHDQLIPNLELRNNWGVSRVYNLDSAKWNASFREFVTAVASHNPDQVKSFIDFPIRNDGNEIWYLADMHLVTQIDPHKIVPFTEKDFDKYYGSIFAMDFRKTLQILNLDQFFQKGTASTQAIEVVKDSKSKLTATYNKTTHKLILKLKSLISGPHPSTFVINYQFDVLKDEIIKFRSVHVT